MKAKYVPPQKTLVTPAEAVAAFRQACDRLWDTTHSSTVAVLVAQSALESGRWRSMWNFNPSNIKCEASREGLYTCIRLNEVLGGKVVWFDPDTDGHPVPEGHPQTRMRAYETFADGVEDKLQFLNRVRYTRAKVMALSGDPVAYSKACREAGYYTASEAPYTRAMASLYKTFLPLAKAYQEPEKLDEQEEAQLCYDMAECMRVELPEWLVLQVERLRAETMQPDWGELQKARDAAVSEP